MFTLQSLMLVALGILCASLIVVAILPSYRSRIQRLTSDEIRRSIPLTEAEIRADKDKLRAQFAIRVHKLEAEGEQQKLVAARQRIEMNRRDARITELQDETERIKAALEENVNARRVLEHTVTDRLPRLEQQLESARDLIKDRDDELAVLKTETNRSVRALDEAMQMNAQQRAEMERISASLATRVPISRDTFTDPKFDGEIALRSEIEALRAKTREQAGLIHKLQSGAESRDASQTSADPDVDQLRRELAAAEAAVKATRESAASGSYDRAAAEAQAKALNSRIDEQAGEIARLAAALAVYENSSDSGAGRPAAQSSRLASKARISALQAQLTQQTETIQRLRSELAASNERLARQAAHYMEEMRRLGSGTVPTSIDPRRGRDAPRRSLADRISQTSRPALGSHPAEEASDAGLSSSSQRVAEYVKALQEDPAPASASTSAPGAAAQAATGEALAAIAQAAAADSRLADVATPEAPKRKLRLMERISSAGKG